MKARKTLLIALTLLLLPLTALGCSANDPIVDPVYFGDVIHLVGDGKTHMEFRVDVDPTKLAVNAKPTIITRGIALGYSLPVGGADEELFMNICVPDRWDGQHIIHIHTRAWLDTAQDNALDAVKLSLDYRAVGAGDVVPNTYGTVVTEIVTGIVPQYTVLEFDFDIPYAGIEGDDVLFLRLTRIASSQEIAGEPVITDTGAIFLCDKIGTVIAE